MDLKGIITSPYAPAVGEGRRLSTGRFFPILHCCCRRNRHLSYTILQILTGEQRQLGERHIQLEPNRPLTNF